MTVTAGNSYNVVSPLLDQEDRSLALACSLVSDASRHILKNCIPSLLMPPACSTTKGSTVCGCTLPYLACFIAVAAMTVASGMWHAAGRAACEGPTTNSGHGNPARHVPDFEKSQLFYLRPNLSHSTDCTEKYMERVDRKLWQNRNKS